MKKILLTRVRFYLFRLLGKKKKWGKRKNVSKLTATNAWKYTPYTRHVHAEKHRIIPSGNRRVIWQHPKLENSKKRPRRRRAERGQNARHRHGWEVIYSFERTPLICRGSTVPAITVPEPFENMDTLQSEGFVRISYPQYMIATHLLLEHLRRNLVLIWTIDEFSKYS